MKPAIMAPLIVLLFWASTTVAASPQDATASLPTITFTKEFPGSSPAYVSIALRRDGQAFYRLQPDEKPTLIQISSESTEEIFALAGKLENFRGAMLESKRKVAHMGTKSFRYENGEARDSVSYNHTENADALTLTALFERLATTQQHRDRIEYLLRFDRLGIVKELLQLETDFDQGRLLESGLLLPILEKVQSDSSLVNVAHQRAAGIIAKLQSGGH